MKPLENKAFSRGFDDIFEIAVWWRRPVPSYYHGNDKMDFLDKTDSRTDLALIEGAWCGNGRNRRGDDGYAYS